MRTRFVLALCLAVGFALLPGTGRAQQALHGGFHGGVSSRHGGVFIGPGHGHHFGHHPGFGTHGHFVHHGSAYGRGGHYGHYSGYRPYGSYGPYGRYGHYGFVYPRFR